MLSSKNLSIVFLLSRVLLLAQCSNEQENLEEEVSPQVSDTPRTEQEREKPKKTYEANIELLVPWSQEAQNREPFTAPYLSLYSDTPTSLLYLAADHESGLETKTFTMIRETLPKFKADIVVIEGLPSAEGESPSGYLDYAKRCWGVNGSQQCGEPSYLAYLANKSSVPFVGGEPSDPELLKSVKEVGYSDRDMFGFYYIRQLGRWNADGVSAGPAGEKSRFDGYFEQTTIPQFKQKGDVTFGFDDFQQWYQERMGKVFQAPSIQPFDTAPIQTSNATWAQELAARLSYLRDAHLAKLLAELLTEHDRVMVGYGSGHLATKRAVLADMLGQPEWSKKQYP